MTVRSETIAARTWVQPVHLAVAQSGPCEEIRRLDAISTLPTEYPGWMLATQGADGLQLSYL
jgi:hypothetical protein